ncbi:AEC family transporter [Metabacillus litoralis]|uniref:AEC family transporter n=1 Tax=Metabacillus litoralis TaxID=152268 RepID=A0A5C6V9M4_9BACI|nr:AEC family transporter [Metabacillus litoralis]TXC82202.1 AEC family transporter [Metabacillus litoralis]
MNFIIVLVPVFFIFAVGYVGQKWIGFDTRTLSKMAIYLMSPFLALRTFYQNELSLDYVYLTIYALGLCFGLISIVYLLAYVKKYNRKETSSLILSSVFMNNGNFGTPVALFVFGTTGFDIAVILLVIQQLIMSTVGVYYAAKGSEVETCLKDAILAALRIPIAYGAVIGLLLQVLHIEIPDTLYQSINLIADAAIPTIMIILGMQLAKISLVNLEVGKILYSINIKLLIAPLVACAFVWVLPVSEVVGDIMVLMAAMPSAANTTMFALQFNTKPEFVSSVTLISTIMSIITLPIVLFLLSL